MIRVGDVLTFSEYEEWEFQVCSIAPVREAFTPTDPRVRYKMTARMLGSDAISDTEWVLYSYPQIGTGGTGKSVFTFLGGVIAVTIVSSLPIDPIITELGEEHREWAEAMLWRSA